MNASAGVLAGSEFLEKSDIPRWHASGESAAGIGFDGCLRRLPVCTVPERVVFLGRR